MSEQLRKGRVNPHAFIIGGLIIVAAASRLIPHPFNVTPVTAIALFGGAYLGRRHWALLLPLTAVMLSDVVLYIRDYQQFIAVDFLMTHLFVYGAIVTIVGVGHLFRPRRAAGVVGTCLLSSVIYFLITNFGWWATSGLHAYNFAGLIECYTLGLPFFRNTVLGAAFFCTVLFGTASLWESQRRLAPAAVPVQNR